MITSFLRVSLLAPALWSTVFAGDSSVAQTGKANPDAVNVEVVQGPRVVGRPKENIYPNSEIWNGREGWVILEMMIAPDGKPYAVKVANSNGNPAFEKAAFRALEQMTFEPARRGGIPIDSYFTLKLKFAIENLEIGASPRFVKIYRKFGQAIEARDKVEADAQRALLEPQNLYEEAFANYGSYLYHRAWGTTEQQWQHLDRAIAGERGPEYLPREIFAAALYEKFRIEVNRRGYGEALDTWEILEPLATEQMHLSGKATVDKILALRDSNQKFGVRAAIADSGSWRSILLRNSFTLGLESGAISGILVRCSQRYASFGFEPGIEYSVGSGSDRCGIEVAGEPGTKFEIIQ